MSRRRRVAVIRLSHGIVGVCVVGAGWELAVRTGAVDRVYLPTPSTVIGRLPGLFAAGPLRSDVLASLAAVGVGTAIANVIALALALCAYKLMWFRMTIAPVIELIRGIAPLALLPAFLLLFGLGQSSAIAIIVWCAWVPIYLNVLSSLDAIDPTLIRSARAMGAGPVRIVSSVYVPATADGYLTGLRLAFGAGWLAVVAAEMLGSNAGLGFRILEWSQTFRIVDMYAAIVVIGLIGLAINMVVTGAQRRVTRWRVE
jgi:NitT/TauT family transport system permease protein